MIKTGSDFSGVGAFEQALKRLGVEHETVFACDMDKYARQTFIENYGEPDYFPENVYDREIPKESLDIYMTSPPCQAFSLAGKRKGEDDKRGVLFYNSHEFIQKNNPRYFIFENVKGLLSDDNGKTFQRWIDMLGGKSVNGNPVLFPHDESVHYHVYYKVLNAKDYGVPQNRERVFIIGIRDDQDNEFSFPKPFHLVKRLKDVLESEVDEKYFLSDKMIEGLTAKNSQDNGFTFKPKQEESMGNCVTARCFKMGADDNYIETKIGAIRGRGNENDQMLEINENGTSNALTTVQKDNVVIIPANNSKGYDIAEEEEDSINFSNPNSETRRGRVGKEVAQTLDTSCNQGVLIAHVSRSEEGKKIRKESLTKGKDFTPFQAKQIEFEEADIMNCITTATTKDNLIIDDQYNRKPREYCDGRTTITSKAGSLKANYIRRLTPRECFRLMDFPDTFKWTVSDTQAYKQAGNSIVVNVLCEILKKIKL